MKKFIILSAITAISCTAYAGDKQFIDFALKQVHDRNFNQCDEAVLALFENAGGQDIRVVTNINPDFKNQIRITSVYGNKGDSIYLDALITKADKTCVSAKTLVIQENKSCTASLADSKPFEYQSETADYIFAKNSGGVNLLLTPASSSCVMIYHSMNTFKAK